MQASESLRLKNRWPRALGARKPEISPRTQTREKRPSRVFFIWRVSSLTVRTAREGFSFSAAAGFSGSGGGTAGSGLRQGNSGAGGATASVGGGGSGRGSKEAGGG